MRRRRNSRSSRFEEGKDSAHPPCGLNASDTSQVSQLQDFEDSVDIVLRPVGQFVDMYMQGMGVLPMPDQLIGQMFYPNIRRFFSLLIVGIVLILLGVLFKIWDSLTGFIDGGRKEKEKQMVKRSRLYRDRPVRRMLPIGEIKDE